VPISAEDARAIALRDAAGVYRDVSIYEIDVTPGADGGWDVVFHLADPSLDGGGPEYAIAADGSIASKRYYQ
jgi:hypothetical protein